MNDNEIIKALECCGNIVDSTCKKCVYHETYNASCVVRLMRDALDLINRQKAEIERLTKENKEQKLILEAINDEMNPLPFETDFDKAIKQAKSEAYREFAEKLKAELAICRFGYCVTTGVSANDIDTTLKELTRNLHGTCTETTDQTATNHSVSLIDGHIEGEG